MTLKYDDDARLHSITDEPSWRESYYLNFFSEDNDLHGLAYQAVTPNRGVGETYFVLFDGDDTLVWSCDDAVLVPEDIGAERMSLGHQTFECRVPWAEWQVRYDDPAKNTSVTVDWERMTDVCDWNWGELTGSTHVQHAGRIRCSGQVAGQEIEFAGFGERDRAWGPRRWSDIDLSWFVVAHFPDGAVVHAFIHRAAGAYHLMGYLHQDGLTQNLARFEARDIIYSKDGGPVESAVLSFEDVEGRSIEVVAIDRYDQYLAFASTEGSGIELQKAHQKYNGPRMFLTFQRFERSDGVIGRGMIDNNLTNDSEVQQFIAGPATSQLHKFDNKEI